MGEEKQEEVTRKEVEVQGRKRSRPSKRLRGLKKGQSNQK
jgi:hypothetical protein